MPARAIWSVVSCWSGVRSSRCRNWVKPSTALSGVRSSWLTRDRNALDASPAAWAADHLGLGVEQPLLLTPPPFGGDGAHRRDAGQREDVDELLPGPPQVVGPGQQRQQDHDVATHGEHGARGAGDGGQARADRQQPDDDDRRARADVDDGQHRDDQDRDQRAAGRGPVRPGPSHGGVVRPSTRCSRSSRALLRPSPCARVVGRRAGPPPTIERVRPACSPDDAARRRVVGPVSRGAGARRRGPGTGRAAGAHRAGRHTRRRSGTPRRRASCGRCSRAARRARRRARPRGRAGR